MNFPDPTDALRLSFVAAGCALGGVGRYLVTMAFFRLFGNDFPWGTLTVNVLGCFTLGVLLGHGFLSTGGGYAFGAVGFCGGLTTFSTFALETSSLVSKRRPDLAGWNVFVSVLLCGLFLIAGHTLGEWRRGL